MREKVFHQRSITGILINESKCAVLVLSIFANKSTLGMVLPHTVVTVLVWNDSLLGSVNNILWEHVACIHDSWDVANLRYIEVMEKRWDQKQRLLFMISNRLFLRVWGVLPLWHSRDIHEKTWIFWCPEHNGFSSSMPLILPLRVPLSISVTKSRLDDCVSEHVHETQALRPRLCSAQWGQERELSNKRSLVTEPPQTTKLRCVRTSHHSASHHGTYSCIASDEKKKGSRMLHVV